MSIISGPFLCFECSEPQEIVMNIHRLYANKQEAQERIKKIKEIGYKNAAAIDLGEIAAFVYKKSGAMVVSHTFIQQAKLNSSPVSISKHLLLLVKTSAQAV